MSDRSIRARYRNTVVIRGAGRGRQRNVMTSRYARLVQAGQSQRRNSETDSSGETVRITNNHNRTTADSSINRSNRLRSGEEVEVRNRGSHCDR